MARVKNSTSDVTSILDSDIYNDIVKALDREFVDSDEATLSKPRQFVSSGSVLLDTIISNDKVGGFPVGAFSMIVGEPSSGKSLLAAHALKSTQDMGGVAIYLDNERSADEKFLKRIGINVEKLIYRQPETIEQTFQMAETIIRKIIERNKGKKSNTVTTIVWDSVVSAMTVDEKDMEYGDKKYASQAGIISTSLRKIASLIKQANVCFIMVNQLRVNLQRQNPYQDPYIIPGGEAPKFWSSVILRLKRKTKQEVDKMIVGYETQIKVTKNKISGDGRFCNFDIFFNRGIDDSEHILEVLKSKKDDEKIEIVNQQKTALVLENGEKVEFKNKEWSSIYKEHKEYIDNLVRQCLIIDLSNPNIEIERTDIKDDDIEEEPIKVKSKKDTTKILEG